MCVDGLPVMSFMQILAEKGCDTDEKIQDVLTEVSHGYLSGSFYISD